LPYEKSGLGLIPIAATASVAPATAAAPSPAATSSAAAVATPATASAAAAIATAAAAAATTTAAAISAAAPFFFRAGFIDSERPAVMLLPIKGGDGGRGFFVAGHFDKTKTFAASRVAIVNDLGAGDLPVLGKQLFEIRAGYVVAQISHIKLLTHFRISYEWVDTDPHCRSGSFGAGLKEVETQPMRERGDTERRKEQNTMQFPDANGRDEPATLTPNS
jgi:hypothetical protein